MKIAIVGKGTLAARGHEHSAGVLALAREVGFDAVDAGPLRNARYVEPLAVLNVRLGYGRKLGTDIGFALIH